jgi:hypothetical protein
VEIQTSTRDALMRFRSSVGGRPAYVRIFSGRIDWAVLGSDRVTELVPLSAISSIEEIRTGPTTSSLVVCANGKTIEFQVESAIADEALPLLQQLSADQPSSLDGGAPPSGRGSLAEDLINLKWLLDNGTLTESEFDAHRARLFGF